MKPEKGLNLFNKEAQDSIPEVIHRNIGLFLTDLLKEQKGIYDRLVEFCLSRAYGETLTPDTNRLIKLGQGLQQIKQEYNLTIPTRLNTSGIWVYGGLETAKDAVDLIREALIDTLAISLNSTNSQQHQKVMRTKSQFVQLDPFEQALTFGQKGKGQDLGVKFTFIGKPDPNNQRACEIYAQEKDNFGPSPQEAIDFCNKSGFDYILRPFNA